MFISGENSCTSYKRMPSPKKVLLNVLWDYKGVIHFWIIGKGSNNEFEHVLSFFDRFGDAFLKRPALIYRNKIIFHHGGAGSHTAKVTQHKLKSF